MHALQSRLLNDLLIGNKEIIPGNCGKKLSRLLSSLLSPINLFSYCAQVMTSALKTFSDAVNILENHSLRLIDHCNACKVQTFLHYNLLLVVKRKQLQEWHLSRGSKLPPLL